MRRSQLIYLVIALPALLTGSVSNSAAEQPTLSHEVILETDADPWAMVAASGSGNGSNGMIVAGNSGRAAWGAKFDVRGQIVWDYTIGLQDEFKYPVPYAQFRGAASMPDGSVFLCGNMPRPLGSTASWVVLSHLDPNGRPLSETFPKPDDHANPGVRTAGAAGCVYSDDGVVVLAETSRVIRSPEKGVLPKLERFYWVFAIDAAGRIKWETQIPMKLFNGVFQPGLIMAAVGADVIFSATNNESTELVTIGAGGVVKSRNEIPGRFVLVRPVPSAGPIHLFGTFDDPQRSAVVTLDDHLVEMGRIRGDHPSNFLANFAYSATGDSIVLFGSTVHGGGATYTSLVVSIDRALKAERTLEFSRRPLRDIGFIRAAAPSGGAGDFVVARSVLVVDSEKLPEAERPKTLLRLALDYLHLK
jgi:hypothetical protein